jgi:formyltetrahydrofolate-dependent phosphoribosylglycinamide formyltransferase
VRLLVTAGLIFCLGTKIKIGIIFSLPYYFKSNEIVFVAQKICTFVRMFQKLQKKWNINGPQLFFVLCVFAIGGSITGYIGKIFMNLVQVEATWLWTIMYILVVTLIWPFAVLLVSIPFGQFAFFKQYIRKLGQRMRLLNQNVPSQSTLVNGGNDSSGISLKNQLIRVAIFASGTGSNAQKIIDHFRTHPLIRVNLIVCNKPGAGVLAIADSEKIPVLLIEKLKFFNGDGYLDELRSAGIDIIVLAGFLWKIPQTIINAFRNRIINIHPALLPKFGGKGMYGNKVHEAVINAGEAESGITIHVVDEHYDNGDIIFQARVNITENETPDTLAEKIHHLEHSNFPRIIEEFILSQMVVKNR